MRSRPEGGFGATAATVAVALPMEIHLTSQKLRKEKPGQPMALAQRCLRNVLSDKPEGPAELCSAHSTLTGAALGTASL